MKEKLKWYYSTLKVFVNRNIFATLIVAVIILQAAIWLAVRTLEDTLTFYRCGSHDYPCHVITQPEPRV
jgi:hypothetical protein